MPFGRAAPLPADAWEDVPVSTKELLRVPYTAVWQSDWCGGLLTLLYPISPAVIPAKGLSIRFASFISEHCSCRWCGQAMDDLASHLQCAGKESHSFMAVAPPSFNGWAKALYEAELAYRQQYELQQRSTDPTPEKISGQLNAQRGRCFLCLKPLVSTSTARFHYEARPLGLLLDTPGVKASELVLVCPSCSNRRPAGKSTSRKQVAA